MSKFVVNTESLEAVQEALAGLALELYYGKKPTARYASDLTAYGTATGFGQLGGADQVFGLFFAGWEGWLSKTATSIENVAQALGNAAEYYAEVDQHVCVPNP
jgi:hypothetical protein